MKQRRKENKKNLAGHSKPGDESDESPSSSTTADPEYLPLWKKLAFSLIPIVLFMVLLEGGLFIAGVEPVLIRDDPFVGFAANIPLFVEKKSTPGNQILETARNKLTYFNHQTFPREKPPGTYRIFCLGGSTTYGRPYNDTVSFAGWLREFLPLADPTRRWEVINAGGISYASYRVAQLMKELAQYEPDLFIIYSGHNEFLERRSYSGLRDAGGLMTSLAGQLARTRTWTALSWLMHRTRILSENQDGRRTTLPGEVETILRQTGPDSYSRDDDLQKEVAEHYRVGIERMVAAGKSAGAAVILVAPAANLKDCTPFKSEHTDGLTEQQNIRSQELFEKAKQQINHGDWAAALGALDEALAFDPRFAELHYRRGKVLFDLGQYAEAKAAFQSALDQDVCPLRILPSMSQALVQIAERTGVPLVDLPRLLEKRLQTETGHTIPGQEYFLDHVHLSIKGHQFLAEKLIEVMQTEAILKPSETWNDQAIMSAEIIVQSRFDKRMQAEGLANLAQVLDWSGKSEDAQRLALQALELDVKDSDIVENAATVLALHYVKKGDPDLAWDYFQQALHADPMDSMLHLRIGQWIVDTKNRGVEMGFAHILHASVFWPGQGRDETHLLLGVAMAQRGRYDDALAHFLEAKRLNPESSKARIAIKQIQEQFGVQPGNAVLQKVTVKKYPSGAVSRIVQVTPDAAGRYIADGFWTEWYEGGELKRFVEYKDGTPAGSEMIWDQNGNLLENFSLPASD